jgi:predicted O-methyltransferase YrrM
VLQSTDQPAIADSARTPDQVSPDRVFRRLLEERPCFHGPRGDKDWSASSKALSYIASTVQPGWRTLEIGAGYSTIVFALCGAEHVVIAPLREEFERIEAWAAGHGLSFDNVSYLQGVSEHILPTLETGPLDLVLIDGWHAFPSPFINWYYAAELLKVGGIAVLDDTQLRTYHVLDAFLRAEKGRWALESRIRNLGGPSDAVAYRKLASDVHVHFSKQPWMAHPVGYRRPLAWLRRCGRALMSRLSAGPGRAAGRRSK